MPPSSRPTTRMCSKLSMRAKVRGMRRAEVRRCVRRGSALLLARRVLQGHAGSDGLGREHRDLLASLPLDHGKERARVLELVVELDAETRRIRVLRLVELRRGG